MPPKSNAVDLQHHPQSVFAAPRSWKIGAVFNPSRYSRLRHNIFALRLLMLSALGFDRRNQMVTADVGAKWRLFFREGLLRY